MFSKQEASQLRKDFWTAFGLYMRPIPSAEGDKINWINYKTGEKDIFLAARLPVLKTYGYFYLQVYFLYKSKNSTIKVCRTSE